MLEDAWDAAQEADVELRVQLRTYETTARKAIAGGSFSEVQANGRRSAFSLQGPGQVTPAEVAVAWRELIDFCDESNSWLTDCGKYGIDPAVTELQGFPEGLTPVGSPL